MTSSHNDDLDFFGQSISLDEETAVKESYRQTERINNSGNVYELECDYDWDENVVFLCLSRNGTLTLYQTVELTPLHRKLPLAKQVQMALRIEKDHLASAFRLTSRIGENPFYLNGLGLFFYSKNLWQESQELFEKALKNKPDFSDPYKNLSNVFLKMGLPEKSMELLRTAVKLNSNFADLHNALAWVYLECGKAKEARYHLDLALELNPGYREAQLNMCLIHLQAATAIDGEQALQEIKDATNSLRKAVGTILSRDGKGELSSWDEVSRQYLIHKDKQTQTDTTNIKAYCELVYIRFLRERPNLTDETLIPFIILLREKVKAESSFADLKNFLGLFYLFLSGYFVSSASVFFGKSKSSSQSKKRAKACQSLITELEEMLEKSFHKLMA
ncbi:MAG: hypothetical protein L0Y74_04295 [candidate division Zixibacteria bacterium]|nr:hypothetical protein [candidate division Zixibacteria bacterium]